jgi:GntR family transcriptional repressor for pyruvate dehydrogenase complex
MVIRTSVDHTSTTHGSKPGPRSVRNTSTLSEVPSSSPIPRVSVPDHVFARLSEAILAGHYRPGERLPPQRALAADLQVNMASIREALGRLEQLRLIDVRHGDGARVLDWRRSGGLEALVLHGGAEASVLGDVFEARRLLLVEAARLAAERHSEQQAVDLQELADAVAVAANDDAALMADWEFMAALVEAAGNLVFQLAMNSVRELYLPHARAFAALVAHREEMSALYARAAFAVTSGDGQAAAMAIDELVTAQGALMLG